MMNMKKMLTKLLAMAMTASLFCMPALAAEGDLHLLGSKEDSLLTFNFSASTDYAPEEGEEGYLMLGIGEQTEFWAAYMFTTPGSESETPAFQNAADVLFNRGQKRQINGVYLDGTFYPANEATYAPYASIQQIVLGNSEGDMIPTHSADLKNTITRNASVVYKMINLEDGFFGVDTAAKLRAVAAKGYWGGAKDVNMAGIANMQAMMADSGEFTDDEIAMLNPGVALTATQFAIWELVNANEDDGRQVVNVQYIVKNRVAGYNNKSYNTLKLTPESEIPCVDLIFKLSNYLVNLEGMTIEEKTASNTILSAENILTNVQITADSVTFDMLQTSETDGLVAKIVDANGETVATGRIAGAAQEGEAELTKNEDGSYTFDIALPAGTYTVVVEGTQDLSSSAFIYTAETREISETMIGFGAVHSAVNVESAAFTVEETESDPEPVVPYYYITVNYLNKATNESIASSFAIAYDEGTAYNVTAQGKMMIPGYTWDSISDASLLTGTLTGDVVINVYYVEGEVLEIPELPTPLQPSAPTQDETIIDETDIPLADVPETGDPLTVMAAMSVLSAAGVYFTGKKRDEE